MSLLDKLLGASKKKAIENKPKLEEALKLKLKGLVYDDELVNELLPVFAALQGVEGFSTVLELLESKERQIEAITSGDLFKQEVKQDKTVNTNEDDNDADDVSNLVDQILSKKYKE